MVGECLCKFCTSHAKWRGRRHYLVQNCVHLLYGLYEMQWSDMDRTNDYIVYHISRLLGCYSLYRVILWHFCLDLLISPNLLICCNLVILYGSLRRLLFSHKGCSFLMQGTRMQDPLFLPTRCSCLMQDALFLCRTLFTYPNTFLHVDNWERYWKPFSSGIIPDFSLSFSMWIFL